MTQVVELDTAGGRQSTRIFSLRGCHLLGMLARTKAAKEFRHWVLDVLEKEVSGSPNPKTTVCTSRPNRLPETLAKHGETGYYGRTTSSSGLHRTRQLRLFYA